MNNFLGAPSIFYILSHCNTLQHTATHCNTLQHTATHCNNTRTGPLPRLSRENVWNVYFLFQPTGTLQLTATHCNTLQTLQQHRTAYCHTATHCNTLQHSATLCNNIHTGPLPGLSRENLWNVCFLFQPTDPLQLTATHCNTLQTLRQHRTAARVAARKCVECAFPFSACVRSAVPLPPKVRPHSVCLVCPRCCVCVCFCVCVFVYV